MIDDDPIVRVLVFVIRRTTCKVRATFHVAVIVKIGFVLGQVKAFSHQCVVDIEVERLDDLGVQANRTILEVLFGLSVRLEVVPPIRAFGTVGSRIVEILLPGRVGMEFVVREITENDLCLHFTTPLWQFGSSE